MRSFLGLESQKKLPHSFILLCLCIFEFNSMKFQSVSSVTQFLQFFATPWTEAYQASLFITNSQSLLKLMSIRSMTPCSHLMLCRPLLLLLLIFPSIRVISKESVLCIRLPKYWSFSFSISTSNEHSGLIFFRMDWVVHPKGMDLQSKGLSRVFSNTIVQKHQFFSTQLSL